MKPSEVADKLRRIATALENSTHPHRDLVAQDLNKIIIAIAPGNFSPGIKAKSYLSTHIDEMFKTLQDKGWLSADGQQEADQLNAKVHEAVDGILDKYIVG